MWHMGLSSRHILPTTYPRSPTTCYPPVLSEPAVKYNGQPGNDNTLRRWPRAASYEIVALDDFVITPATQVMRQHDGTACYGEA